MDAQKAEAAQNQNAQINTVPTDVENKVIISSSQKKERPEANANKIYLVIAVLFLILILGELGFVFIFHHSLRDIFLPSSFSLSFQNKSKTGNTYTPSPPIVTQTLSPNVIIPIPTGQQDIHGTGATSGFTIHIDKVIKNPTDTSGDKPLKGLQYIEFDVTVTNNTTKTTPIPGMFYIHDSSTGKLFLPADMLGYLNDSRVVSALSQKKVTITGKQSLYSADIQPGQTVTRYLIYQILPQEKGQLVWDDSYILTEIPTGEKVAQKNILVQTMQGKIAKALQYTEYDSGHNNKITVFSF